MVQFFIGMFIGAVALSAVGVIAILIFDERDRRNAEKHTEELNREREEIRRDLNELVEETNNLMAQWDREDREKEEDDLK